MRPAANLTLSRITLAVGGDCPADIALLRGQPRLFGLVASDPTVSRRIDKLAADIDATTAALRSVRAQARALRLRLAPLAADAPVSVDIDATILIAHSDQGAGCTYLLPPEKVAVDLPSDLGGWSARLPRVGSD